MQVDKVQRAALRKLFSYDAEKGILAYRARGEWNRFDRMFNTRYAGKSAGWTTDHGYVRCAVSVCGLPSMLYAHQIIFAIMRGFIPESVDHKNRKRNDNRWSNLRACTAKLQARNTNKRKTNKSGVKGVSWAKRNECWRMDIQVNGVKFHSYHKTKREAAAAYKRSSKKLHGKWGCADAHVS